MIRVVWRIEIDGKREQVFQDKWGTRPRLKWEPGVLVITDASGDTTSFPLDLIERVHEDQPPRGF